MTPAIFGLSGPVLAADERAFLREADPAGVILFRRNCVDQAQLRALTDALRSLAGRADLLILVDQEGGRVQRLGPPAWGPAPPAEAYARLWRRAPASAVAAARAGAQAAALTLRDGGVNANCAPVLDLRRPDTHPALADRCFGDEPLGVAALGRAVLDGLAAGGVAGVIKHLPGQGRARADSHLELPTVAASAAELAGDLRPFQTLRAAPIAMVAHVCYPAWDRDRPASLSPAVIGDVIRGSIGFAGLLLPDDLRMDALCANGDAPERSRAALAAGCDLALNCASEVAELARVAAALPPMGEGARERLARATEAASAAPEGDAAALLAVRDRLLALA